MIKMSEQITHLQLLDDPVISKLKKSELNSIVMENVYHNPKESEVDPDGDSNKTYIIIQDIEWRSDCLQMFLRDYLDVLFYQQTIDKRRQKRVFDDSCYAPGEDTALLNAPRWTKSEYNRSMLSIVTRTVENYKDNVNDPVNTRHHLSRKKSRSTEEAEDAE
ncbi:hypothetical protein RclHR1_21400005 [Rhizophagus clarus]|nr:hypothetical protein RclHR1_21400005 [Rhizophagus clarus]